MKGNPLGLGYNTGNAKSGFWRNFSHPLRQGIKTGNHSQLLSLNGTPEVVVNARIPPTRPACPFGWKYDMEDKMNHRALFTILIGATALSVFPVQPRASAQETLTFWNYQPGTGGTRQPRTGTSGHFVKLAGPTTVGGPLVPGSTIAVQTSMPSTYPSASPLLHYGLAYISITGGAEGGISVFPDASGTLPLTVNVTLPNTPNPQIAVNVYYFPEGGGPCPPGMVCGTEYIDEFGEVQGTLLNDTFVNVFIPPATTPNAALTTTGNVDGTVSTGNNAVRINADPITPTGGSFDKWVSGPGGTVSANNLNVGRGTTAYAMALYHSSCPDGYYWNPSATISQCSLIPVCPEGQAWNATTDKCAPVTGKCPPACRNGCYLPYIGPQGQPIWNCKPPSGCNMHCPSGQYCSEVGVECNCLRCTPIGQVPQSGNHPVQ
jgi:hypothetical protein